MVVLLPLLAACIDPVAYGAKPDDKTSDTEAIQKAIAAAEADAAKRPVSPGVHDAPTVCLGAGVWNLERTSELGSLMVRTGGIAIRGAGPKTILRMTGDGRHGDWRAIEITGAADVSVSNLTIDGLDAFNTEEQTHLVEVGPGSHDISLSNLSLGPMRRPDQKVGDGIGGDCVRLLGSPKNEVSDVSITDSVFTDCDRSGISFERAVHSVAISRDRITGTGDTPIDFEPTGHGSVSDVAMTELEIHRKPNEQGAWSITIGGTKTDLASHIIVANSILDGGGIGMLNVDDVRIVKNKITHGVGAKATIDIIRRADNVYIGDNTISRPTSSPNGLIIRAQHDNKHMPHGLVVERNTIAQDTKGAFVETSSVSAVTVRGNTLSYGGSETLEAAITTAAVIDDVDSIEVDGNQIHGAVRSVISVNAGKHKIRAVAVHDNTAKGAAMLACRGDASQLEDFGSDDSDVSACKDVKVRAIPKRKK